ncbi:galactose mutarotase-like domain-containing protein [Ochromonadaceae sp. CCMP2298]|nr:galactose mutarotase-like domain-containing protein [Ochromonadaceae sp. CCMP2298]
MYTVSPVTEGRNGQPKVRLAGGEHSCDVYLYGCTVASWVHSGTEKLFCSPITPFDGKKAIRGGIPLVFPQFGRPDESMPQHGFARTSNWTLAGTGGGESAIAVFGLTNGEHSLSWPHKFALEYTVELSAAGLRTSIKISNTDATPFSCQTLLHTYVAVPAIERVQVRGLQGSYYDQLAACTAQDDRAVATVDAEVDRIYTASVANPPSVEVAADGLLLVKVDRRAYKLIGDAPLPIPTPADVVFWNAWVDKTASIGDLENDAYLRYICVEPGVVSSAQEVQPGTSMVLEQTLTC